MHHIRVNRFATCGMKNNDIDFKESYGKTPKEFIEKNKKDIYDADGKIIVVVECAKQENNIPLNITDIRIMRDGNKNANIIYSNYITFLKYETLDKREVVYFKDDECEPLTFKQFCEDNNDELYDAIELGFDEEDILNQIRSIIHGMYDFRCEVEKEDIIFLKGL